MKIIVIAFSLASLIVTILVFVPSVRKKLPLPASTNHLLNLISREDNLYEPIAESEIKLSSQGFMGQVAIQPGWNEFYNIALIFDSKESTNLRPFSSLVADFDFDGVVELAFYHKEHLLETVVVDRFREVLKLDEGRVKINLHRFAIPFKNRFRDLNIVFKIRSAASGIDGFSDKALLVVAVSSIP